jgi:hypothetical protein
MMDKKISKNTEKIKKTIYETVKLEEPNTNNFDIDEPEFQDDEIDEEDHSQREIYKREKNDSTNDTPYITPRKIHYEILKTNKGYKIITTTINTKITKQIQTYLDSFPKFVELTKDRLEECFISDRNQAEFFVIDKNLNKYHNILLPNGDVIPLVNLIRSGGGRVPKNIKNFREYREFMYRIKNKFDKLNDYFKPEDIDFIDTHQEIKYEYIILNLIEEIGLGNSKNIEKFTKDSELVQIELDELLNNIKGDKL